MLDLLYWIKGSLALTMVVLSFIGVMDIMEVIKMTDKKYLWLRIALIITIILLCVSDELIKHGL